MLTNHRIRRFAAALRDAQRGRNAVRELNGFPPGMQKDIGWPASSESRAALNVRNAFMSALG